MINRAIRLATIGALTAAAVALPSAASADSVPPAYNVTQPIGVPNASSVAADPVTHRLFISGDVQTSRTPLKFADSLSIVDATTNAIITTVPGPDYPTALAVDTANRHVFVLRRI